MPEQIPAFSSDGRRLRLRYSLSAIARLEGLHLIGVQRNRKGRILAIEFLGPSGATPVRHAPHRGTKYSFLRRISETTRCWELREI